MDGEIAFGLASRQPVNAIRFGYVAVDLHTYGVTAAFESHLGPEWDPFTKAKVVP